jgi:hypothetical protein
MWKANGKTTTLQLFLDSLSPKTEKLSLEGTMDLNTVLRKRSDSSEQCVEVSSDVSHIIVKFLSHSTDSDFVKEKLFTCFATKYFLHKLREEV